MPPTSLSDNASSSISLGLVTSIEASFSSSDEILPHSMSA